MGSCTGNWPRAWAAIPRRLLAGWAGVALAASSAHALPSLTPHPHGDGKVRYEDDAVKDGDNNHNHLFDRSPRHSSAAGFKYDALAVWDNRTYRFSYNTTLRRPEEPPRYAHGFIEEGRRPRYLFRDGQGADKTFTDARKAMIGEAVKLWVDAARAESKGKTTPDGTPLVTGIGLEAAQNEREFEFRIGFFDGLQEAHSTIGLWMVHPLDTFPGGPSAQDLAKPVLAFDDDVDWLFDTSQKPQGDQVDFFTIALHELGHVFGLDHPAPLTGDPLTGPAGVLMRGGIALENARNGQVFRMVDPSSARGAAGLYTQPVSEPATLGLVISAFLSLALLRRRRVPGPALGPWGKGALAPGSMGGNNLSSSIPETPPQPAAPGHGRGRREGGRKMRTIGRSVRLLAMALAALGMGAVESYGGPLFFKPDLADFYQHQKSGSDPTKPFNAPDLAPADPPIVVNMGMEEIRPGFTNGNWWEDGGGWCCVAAFVNSFHYLDKRGFPGLFDSDPTKPWQQRMAFAIEDLAIDLFGLKPDGDPDGGGPRTRSYKFTSTKTTGESIRDHMAKHGYGPDKLVFSEYFWDESAGKVKQVTPGGPADAPFASMFDVYHAELLRSEDVIVRMEILTSAEQARLRVLLEKLGNGTITLAETLELQGLLEIGKHVWWGTGFHAVTGAGVDRDKAQRKLWFADPDNTFHGSGWGHPYLDTDVLPVPMDPVNDPAERAKYYEEAMLAADGRTFMTGPYADPDGAGPRRAAAIARIFTVSPVPEPHTLILLGAGLGGIVVLMGSRKGRN